MNGLFYCKESSENTTFYLLRFYENGYVLFKKVTTDKKDYLEKQLKTFSMNGHIVNGEPEFTFCGAYQEYNDKITFKVENEITNPSDTWVQKDVLSFSGTINSETELTLKQISKRTNYELTNNYLKTNEQELLNGL